MIRPDITRNRKLYTSFDIDKAAIGFTESEFKSLQNAITAKYETAAETNGWNEALLYNLKRDCERLSKLGTEVTELWMEYWVLEEMSHIVRGADPGLDAEISDALREYDRLFVEP